LNLSYLTETFGFRGTWNPELIVLTVLIGVAYFACIGPLRHTFPGAEPASLRQKILFSAGLLLFYFSLGSPLNVSGHFLFTGHMLQQALLYLVMPLLILAGTPTFIYQYLARYRLIRGILKVFSHPIPAILLFNALFSFYHMPVILDLVMNNLAMHNLIHFILLIAAFFMWMPVIAPVPEIHRLSDLQKVAYIFANGVLITPACALIIFAGSPMYETYVNGPTMLCAPFYSAPIDKSMFTVAIEPLDDQRLGGILMKLMQELNYGIVLAYVFASWYRKERDQPDDQLLPH
jgi:putative membrane protein